ncbi:hypothetical protein NL676_037245 [Syzygium grande]|nr:hypothetical protein NL676_037245 [Syzygium grande]
MSGVSLEPSSSGQSCVSLSSAFFTILPLPFANYSSLPLSRPHLGRHCFRFLGRYFASRTGSRFVILNRTQLSFAMDKHEDKELSDPSASESAVSAGEGGISGGRKETLAGAGDGGGQGQREGSLAAEAVAEEGAFSNGDDIMVEVLGSEVFVDGVCRPGDEENLKAEASRDASAGSSRGWREVRSLFKVGFRAVKPLVLETRVELGVIWGLRVGNRSARDAQKL